MVLVRPALLAIGPPLSGVTADDFTPPGDVYRIGVPPNGIDILTEFDGPTYDKVRHVTVFSECTTTIHAGSTGKNYPITPSRMIQTRIKLGCKVVIPWLYS